MLFLRMAGETKMNDGSCEVKFITTDGRHFLEVGGELLELSDTLAKMFWAVIIQARKSSEKA